MMTNPRVGQAVQVWYGQPLAATAPLHGKLGTVAVASRGKPRNHGVTIDGTLVVVPCGHLRKPAP